MDSELLNAEEVLASGDGREGEGVALCSLVSDLDDFSWVLSLDDLRDMGQVALPPLKVGPGRKYQ